MSDRNEAETRAELIDPALKAAGWGVTEGSRVRREVIAPGRILGAGKRAKETTADYVLVYKNHKLAVVEAKRESAAVTEGLGQAKRDAEKLQTPFCYATNGHGIYAVDLRSGEEGETDQYPTPETLWERIYGKSDAQERYWRDHVSAVAFHNNGGKWTPRYYKHNAIVSILEAIAKGRNRILLTLATGTGKTSVAFEVAWKLFHSRWNLTDWPAGVAEGAEPTRRPRVLFLADRNILADQAFNAFNAFPDDALVRIDPEVIRKKGRVPKNGSIFFTIFQTFMTGRDAEGNPQPSFGEYPPNFFDLIVIDECHRGGATDESNWRGILEYFAPAVQLGLTATPRRRINANTYDYFGDPVYTYSLREGINDGFLTPFRMKQIQTTLDDYVYTPDDEVIEGEIVESKRYVEADFNKIIKIKAREQKRVEIVMREIDQSHKTLVFCATQLHALAVRDLINKIKTHPSADYCARVTADESEIGDAHLRTFQDNEKTIPTILTTSQKLSTGVDALNIRNIVLMRPVQSMIEFKQIIGRGTRLFDGKEYFTVYDFVKAYEHFSDPDWDGDPICETCKTDPCQCEKSLCDRCKTNPCQCVKPDKECPKCQHWPCECETATCAHCGCDPCQCDKPQTTMVTVKLADGKELTIKDMVATSFWDADTGRPLSSTEFLEQLYGDLPTLFQNEAELRALWSMPSTRRKLLDGLQEKGYGTAQLVDLARFVEAENSDLYDVLMHVAYSRSARVMSREERVSTHQHRLLSFYTEKEQEFLQFILSQYVKVGVGELDESKLPKLIALKYDTIHDARDQLGDISHVREVFIGFQKHLYEATAA